MKTCFNGLGVVNIELTSRCDKQCWMCGRRQVDREYPELALNYGDMDFNLLANIAMQLPPDIIIQFHNNGEPLLYPELKKALQLFSTNIRCFNTNAKKLLERADDIINNLESLTISVIQGDKEANEQYEIVKKFLEIKGDKKPLMVYRLLGTIDKKTRWYELPGIVATRILHDPMGSFNYTKKVTVPEHGFCLDLLNHMSINKDGLVSHCVRFDPKGLGFMGDANKELLIDIWNGIYRRNLIKLHKEGLAHSCGLCASCDFYGVPTG